MRKFGDLSPEEQRAAIGVAARQLEAELNHPAMVEALSVPEDHIVNYRQKGPNVVEATCTCKLRAESANAAGADRVMRRKHKDQARKARARARG